MAAQTQIEWADATFNPWIGCTKVGPGCDHCYAEARMDTRLKRVQWGAGNARQRTGAPYWQQPHRWNRDAFRACGNCGWRGAVDTLIDDTCPGCGTHEKLDPARERVFCASLADWLDNEVPIEWLVDLLDLIRRTQNLDWLLLTKRIGNWRTRLQAAQVAAMDRGSNNGNYLSTAASIADWLSGNPPANVWIGATFVNQTELDRDYAKLVTIPAVVHFVSIEPMLGALTFDYWPLFDEHGKPLLHWVICGGESGPGARPMHPDWARSLRDQCAAADVPFLFKQWGEHSMAYDRDRDDPDYRRCSTEDRKPGRWINIEGGTGFHGRRVHYAHRVGKKAAGRLVDGIEHNAFPETKA